MGLLAKLITLTARQTQDADGTDELVMSRGGGVIFERITMSRDDEFEFDDRLLPLNDQVEIILTEVDSESQQHQNLGSVFIRADELNQGELTRQFRGAGAIYDLRYKVI
ncbi:MAG: hypothetical protein JWR80_5594 [Bradyrhizobium sp.]|nr:hypothetical protein [Bradyrhizobium sp.]